jgi:hypothetical protein
MVASRTQYELRVGTRLSAAAIATFRVPLTPTVVPRNTVYRLRISADRDPAEVLQLLTEHNVQVLEIRRCAEPSREAGETAPPRPEAAPPETEEPPAVASAVLIPFPARSEPAAPAVNSAPDGRPPGEPQLDSPRAAQPARRSARRGVPVPRSFGADDAAPPR